MSKLYYSEKNGEAFKELSPLSEAPEIATGGIVDFNDVLPYLGEVSSFTTFTIKKRHISRKYKKKHRLLKRQRKRLIKTLVKVMREIKYE